MGSYEEEIFQRTEQQFSSTSSALAWLSSFERADRGKTKYTEDALKVRDELIRAEAINRDYKRTEEVSELQSLQREASSLKLYGGDISSDINFKIDKISKELAELSEKRKQERLIQEEIERKEMQIAVKVAREQERMQSEDRRKRENAKRQLEKMRERGELE